MLKEEAVQLLMEELGYIWLDNKGNWAHNCWNKDAEYLVPSEALAHCLDLNVLAGIWTTNFHWIIHIALNEIKGKDCLFGCEIWDGKEWFRAIGTIQETCLVVTAEALKKNKEK